MEKILKFVFVDDERDNKRTKDKDKRIKDKGLPKKIGEGMKSVQRRERESQKPRKNKISRS